MCIRDSSYAVPAPVIAAALRALGEELADLNRYPDREFTAPVSYTHLTLPTSDLV